MEEKIAEILMDFNIEPEEADASIALNEALSIAKFIFTDQEKNLNKQRVSEEEFDNIIKSGTYMPFKMAKAGTSLTHKASVPIGVITQMKRDGKTILGLAGLWKEEAKAEIAYLKEMISSGKVLPQVSWEILYSSSAVAEDGITDLHGCVVKGVTVVDTPAYGGRTPILAIASEDAKNKEKETITVENDETVATEVAVSAEQVAELKQRVEDLKTQLAEKETAIASLTQEKDTLAQKVTELTNVATASEKIVTIKNKFKTAGITKPDDYFETNKERFLKYDESEVDFMLQEMVAFASTKTSEASVAIPAVHASKTLSPKELGKALRESRK